MSLREAFAQNLRKYRLEARLSQEALAAEAEVDRTYISALERSVYSASLDMIERLARVLKVDLKMMTGLSSRQILAANLRQLRSERGWSQEDLGAEAELHRTFIGAVERAERNISIDNIEKLSRALGVEGWMLLQSPRS